VAAVTSADVEKYNTTQFRDIRPIGPAATEARTREGDT
jgi:hypothetical protein